MRENPMDRKPNVLFILSDQHNAKVIGHAGHANVKTPNMDRMAAEGVRFTNAITANPICTPSRICYMSGQYPHNHGHYGNSGEFTASPVNMLDHFRQHGYTTAAIGKIHCPANWVEDSCDVFHETCNCSIGGRSKSYTRFLKERGVEQLEDNITLPEFGDHPWANQSMEGRPSKLSFDESQEGWTVSTVTEFIKQAQLDDKPFCVHASFPRPHQCTSPSQEFWDLYEDEDLVLPPNADYDMDAAGKAPHLKSTLQMWRTAEAALLEPKTYDAFRMRKLRGYLAAISQVDHAIGRLMGFLEESGLAENTIVIYGADHGDYACEHGILEKAPGICSDAITRIPLLWWGYGAKSGHVAEEIVSNVDVSSTLTSLTGLPVMETSDGKDMSNLLAGDHEELHRVGVTEFAWSKSIRKGKYRFVFYPQDMFREEYPDGFAELYDIEADPWEMKNLYFDETYRSVVNDMKAELLEWMVRTTRPATSLCVKTTLDPHQTTHRYNNDYNPDGKFNPDRLAEADYRNYI